VRKSAEAHHDKFKSAAQSLERPPTIVPKPFLRKCPEVPLRQDYRGTFEPDFWANWGYSPLEMQPKSWINHGNLLRLAEVLGFWDMEWVRKVCQDLKEGYDIGVRGAARLPSHGENHQSVYEYGSRVADTLCSWVRQGLVAGPLDREELPANIKVSPMSCALKPNGSARVCVNMSWPHLVAPDLEGSVPCSQNAGVDIEQYPTKMVTSRDLLMRIVSVGPSVYMAKIDWADAYKHLHIRPEDLCLQVISFGGKYFVEKALTFGCSSSPGTVVYYLGFNSKSSNFCLLVLKMMLN